MTQATHTTLALPPDPTAERPSLQNVLDALDQLAATLFTDAAEHEREQQARQNWVAGVSHDLKSPLTAIKGYAELLTAGSYSEDELIRIAKAVVQRCENMEALIGDLDMSIRIRSGGDLVMAREPVDLTSIVAHVVAEQGLDPHHGDRTLLQGGETRPVEVPGDEHLLTRAVTNMVVNAMVHNPPGTTVTVSVAVDTGTAKVIVEDDGVGLDPAVLDAFSERAARGVLQPARGPVIGMGMDIARQFVVAHGGFLTIESSRDHGTRIELSLPSVLPTRG